MPKRRHWRTCTSSWWRRRSSSDAARRADTTEPMVMASAPGGTGPPTQSQWSPTRRTRTARSVHPVQINRARSIELGGEGLAVVVGSRILGAEDLQEVDELLARRLVVLHALEEAVELALDFAVRAGRGCLVAEPGDGGDPASLGRLRDAGQHVQRLFAVAAVGEKLAEGDDCTLVIGVFLERLAQGLLVPGRHEPVDLGLAGRQPRDELGDALLRQGADESVDHLAVFDGVDRRD